MITLGLTLMLCSDLSAQKTQIEHLIMNGQSLSTGHQSWPVLSTTNVKGNYMLGDQIWTDYGWDGQAVLTPLQGTVSNTFKKDTIHTRVRGHIAECPLLGCVNHLQSRYPGTTYLATNVGVSGTSIEELSKEYTVKKPNYYSRNFVGMLPRAVEAAHKAGYKLHCPAIFWMQGEYNYMVVSKNRGMTLGINNTTTKEGYKNLLVKMRNNMQKDIVTAYEQKDRPVFITYQTGAQYTRDSLNVGMAQLECANENKDIIMAGPVYPQPDRGGHLDANGYRWFGEILAKAYHQTVMEGKKFKPLQPQAISRENDGHTIRITFHVPVGPLVIDTCLVPEIKNYGFNVYQGSFDDKGRCSPTSISVSSDDVVLTFDRQLTGTVYVTYADQSATIKHPVKGLNNIGAHGNLRDSDPYKSALTYIDLDGKNHDGSYIYDRNNGETRLRPDFEPKDTYGKVIYGKPYSLYNFGVAFFYKITPGQDSLKNLDKR